ncbi:MAG: ROK family protein [candidate division Zixibacteria bacterium]|nr:ROK family protein [candidate division Zixibacteria bacterium]
MSDFNAAGRHILGIDIGGTKLAVVAADRGGNVLHKVRRATEAARGPRVIVDTLCDMAREAMTMAATDPNDIAGIGVSCGGPLDTATGMVYSPPNLPGWDGIPLKAWLEEGLGIATCIENDANASALAEWLYGAGRGYRNVVYMTMSTGIGGGLILDGRLYRGTGDAAGEVGHMTILPGGPRCGCGKNGCLEALCSGPAIARRAREALGHDAASRMLELTGGNMEAVTAETVMEAARQGDASALRLVDETAYYMAIGLGNIVNVLNPEIIIIGTIIVKAGDLLLDPIHRYLRQETWDRVYRMVRIAPAELGNAVGDLAAIAVVEEMLKG